MENTFNKETQLIAVLHSLDLNKERERESVKVIKLTSENCSASQRYNFPIGDKIKIVGYGLYDSIRVPYYKYSAMRVKLGGVQGSQIKWYQFIYCEN